MVDDGPLSDAALGLLQEHGRMLAPPHDGAKLLASILRRLDAPVAASPAPVPVHVSGWLRRLSIVGGACVLGFGLAGLRTTDPPRARLSHAPLTNAQVEPSATTSPTAAVEASVARPDDATIGPSVARSAAAGTVAAMPPATKPPRRPSSDTQDLAAELALLETATAAFGAGRWAAVGVALDEHRRRFPAGQLGSEREATVVMLACARGDAGATDHALAFLTRPQAAPFRNRIASMCQVVRAGGAMAGPAPRKPAATPP